MAEHGTQNSDAICLSLLEPAFPVLPYDHKYMLSLDVRNRIA